MPQMNYPYYPGPVTPPTTPSYQVPQPQISSNMFWVQGESGAKAYPVAPGNTVLLMDSENQVFYIKHVDAVTGMPQPLRIFTFKENIPEPAVEASHDYVTREEFEELKKTLDDLTK